MKRYFLLVLGILLFTIPALAIDVPAAVADAFAKKFPGASKVKWGKENAKEYEAEFQWNGKSGSANFLADGTWVESELEVDITEVPAAVSLAAKTKYPAGNILKAYKIERANSVSFELEIKNGTKKTELILKPDGSIVK